MDYSYSGAAASGHSVRGLGAPGGVMRGIGGLTLATLPYIRVMAGKVGGPFNLYQSVRGLSVI